MIAIYTSDSIYVGARTLLRFHVRFSFVNGLILNNWRFTTIYISLPCDQGLSSLGDRIITIEKNN